MFIDVIYQDMICRKSLIAHVISRNSEAQKQAIDGFEL